MRVAAPSVVDGCAAPQRWLVRVRVVLEPNAWLMVTGGSALELGALVLEGADDAALTNATAVVEGGSRVSVVANGAAGEGAGPGNASAVALGVVANGTAGSAGVVDGLGIAIVGGSEVSARLGSSVATPSYPAPMRHVTGSAPEVFAAGTSSSTQSSVTRGERRSLCVRQRQRCRSCGVVRSTCGDVARRFVQHGKTHRGGRGRHVGARRRDAPWLPHVSRGDRGARDAAEVREDNGYESDGDGHEASATSAPHHGLLAVRVAVPRGGFAVPRGGSAAGSRGW